MEPLKRGSYTNYKKPGKLSMKDLVFFTGILIGFLLLLMMIIPVPAEGNSVKEIESVYIREGDHFVDPLLYQNPGDVLSISVVVNPNPETEIKAQQTVDVYILSIDEYYAAMGGNHYPDKFEPLISMEKVTEISFLWTVPDNGSYYVIVDNRDNGQPTDAVPIGDLNIDYLRAKDIHYTFEAKESSLALCLTTGFIALSGIIFLITAMIAIAMRWRKTHPVIYDDDEINEHEYYDEYYDGHDRETYQNIPDWDGHGQLAASTMPFEIER